MLLSSRWMVLYFWRFGQSKNYLNNSSETYGKHSLRSCFDLVFMEGLEFIFGTLNMDLNDEVVKLVVTCSST